MAGAFYIVKNSGDITNNTLSSLSAVCYVYITLSRRYQKYLSATPRDIFHIGSKELVILYVQKNPNIS